jgi:hypothetical protein
MRTEAEIRKEIEEIRENQQGLRRQGRWEEARHWNDVLYYLHWVLGKRD